GLARGGRLQSSEGPVQTPNLILHREKAAPPGSWGGQLLEREGGWGALSYDLVPHENGEGPPPLSRPLSLQDLEMPTTTAEGPVAFLADPREAGKVDQEIVALQNTVEFLRFPRRFATTMAELRREAGYQRAIYAPLLATPANLPLLVLLGVDFVDTLRVEYDTLKGRFHTLDGPLPVEELEEWPCLCPACERGDLGEHNLRQMLAEVRRVQLAVHRGRIRELTERRLANDPWMTAVLRELDLRLYDWQELHAPVRGPPLKAYSSASLTRPEVKRFRRRLGERYRRPPSAQVLVLLPCSARKPYSTSRSHRLFRGVIRACGNPWAVHVVVVTSPLGLVPLELQLAYPAQHYDVPVTGDWSRDEARILEEDLPVYLAKNRYDLVVSHLGAEAEVVNDLLDDVLITSDGRPRSKESLNRLETTLRKGTADLPPVSPGQRKAEELVAMAEFQFGPGAGALVEGCTTRGRYPYWRLIREGVQHAALTGGRGMMVLTLAGARALSQLDLGWVEIDDFYPEGNVFAVGVDGAHQDIRVGDEAVVRHGGEVRAVGVARMNLLEMTASNRGEAVHVRHKVKSPEAAPG
ncbi:MAG: archaeosine synthase subunit alpha, partial [Thermoplasmata archaeon]